MNVMQHLRKTGAIALAGLAVAVCSPNDAEAADGDPDLSFGDSGKVVTDFFGGQDEARAVAIEKNGKIVAAGRAFNSATASDEFALARYLRNGRLDNSFGNGGKVSTHLPGNTAGASTAIANAVAIQRQGRILAAGSVQSEGASQVNFALLQYDNRGALDPAFGDGGIVITELGGDSSGANDMVLQPDGKIVTVGTVSGDVALLRYNPDGSLDSGFGDGGKVITNVTPDDVGNAVHLTRDGKILVAGQSCVAGSTCENDLRRDLLLLRYNSDGSLDTSFGDQGKVITRLGLCDMANDIAVGPDGSIVAVGFSSGANIFPCVILEGTQFAIARYTPNGESTIFATRFGPGGRGGSVATATAITMDGLTPKIVVGGYYRQFLTCASQEGPNPCNFLLARLNWADGSADPSFGSGGSAIADFAGGFDRAWDLAIQRDGRIIQAGFTAATAGQFDFEPSTSDFALARFLSDDCLFSFLNSGPLAESKAPPPFNDAVDLLDKSIVCQAPHLL
jgi:uncharacterized delta-60 repeat protein